MRASSIQLFNDHQDLLHKFAWSYHRSTGIELEELQNQARYLFFKAYKNFNKGQVKFTTYLYTVLQNDLHNFCFKYRKTVAVGQEIIELECTNMNPSILTEFKMDVLEGLSADAKEVMSIILHDHRDIDFIDQSHVQIRQSIKRFLKEEYQWEAITIKEAFLEIKSCLGIKHGNSKVKDW